MANHHRRIIMRQPMFAIAVVGCVSLTIATICILGTAVRMLEPERIASPVAQELYDLSLADSQGQIEANRVMPFDTFDALRRTLPGTAKLLAYDPFWPVVGRMGSMKRINAEFISSDYFPILELSPVIGRLRFDASDERAPGVPAAIVGEQFWTSECGGERDLSRCELFVSGIRVSVVGVAPDSFRGLWAPALSSTQVWMPIGLRQMVTTVRTKAGQHSLPGVYVKARYLQNAPERQAIANLGAQATAGAMAQRLINADSRVVAINGSQSRLAEQARRALQLASTSLNVLAGIVLAIACVNLINLAVSRAVDRVQELAVRRTLGASTLALLANSVGEATIAVMVGAIGGLLLFYWLTRVSASVVANPLPGFYLSRQLVFSWKDIGLAIASAATLIVVSALPAALQIRALDLSSFLRGHSLMASPGKRRGRYALLLPQVAAATALLLVASVFVLSTRDFAAVDSQASLSRVTSFTLTRTASSLRAQAAADRTDRADAADNADEFLPERLVQTVQGIGGVSVALATRVPYAFGGPSLSGFVPAGADRVDMSSRRLVKLTEVTPGYSQVLGCRMLAGRSLNGGDRRVSPTPVVVNEALTRALGWSAAQAMNRILAIESAYDAQGRRQWESIAVVGVTTCAASPREESEVMRPFRDIIKSDLYLFVATPGPEITRRLRLAVDRVDLGFQVTDVSTLADYERAHTRPSRAFLAGSMTLGALALGLSIIGLFGTVTYIVRTHTRDLAIQIVLGCPPATAVWSLVGQVATMLLIALISGTFAAWVIIHLFQTTLAIGGTLWNPLSLIAIVCIATIAAIAAGIPARRAASVDPAAVLRES